MSASKGPSSCKEKGCRRKLRNEKEMGPCRLKLLEVFRGKKKLREERSLQSCSFSEWPGSPEFPGRMGILWKWDVSQDKRRENVVK
jgi:hypothetical protein